MKRIATLFAVIITAAAGLVSLPCGKAAAMPKVERMVLSNKLVLLHFEDHSQPLVTLQFLIDAGSWRDPSGMEGLANLTSKGLLHGTTSHAVNSVNEELDFMGSSLETSCEKDYTTVTFQTLRKNLDAGLSLVMEVVTQPVFLEEELQREVENVLGTIRAAEDQPADVAEKAFNRALYKSSPYASPVEGTRESVARIGREALVKFYGAYYHPNNTILAVGGDITSDEVKSKIIPLLEAWPAGEVPTEPFESSFTESPSVVRIDRPISQANIILGHEGVARSNEDYYALNVMSYILGMGGFASRLFEEIRIKRGLAYSVYSYFEPHKHPGSFQVVLQTKNSSAKEAISLVVQEMKRMQEEPVTEEELESARRYLIGSFPLRYDTQRAMAGLFNQIEYYGLQQDYPERYPSLIGAVTKEDVLRVARTYLHPDSYVLVVVGDLEKTGME